MEVREGDSVKLWKVCLIIVFVTFTIEVQSNLNGSNIFGTMEIRLKHG